MAIKCMNNGVEHTHETVAESRACYGIGQTEVEVMDRLSGIKTQHNAPSDKQVRYALDLLASRVWPDEFSEDDLKAMERRQVSDLIDRLYKAPKKGPDRRVGANGAKQEFKDIPDGRYALKWESLKNSGWKFYQVKHGHTQTFVDLLIGSPGAYRKTSLRGKDRNTVLFEIRRVTPRQASVDFGLESGTCGVCSSPLTNEESLKLGIGPICRGKMGW